MYLSLKDEKPAVPSSTFQEHLQGQLHLQRGVEAFGMNDRQRGERFGDEINFF